MQASSILSQVVAVGLLTSWLPPFYLPEETCFQQVGSSAVEGTSQFVLGIFWPLEGTTQPVIILKMWKIPSSRT